MDEQTSTAEFDDELIEDVGALADTVRRFMNEGESSRRAYLRESWLAATIAQLRRARQDAGLSQSELAERLDTKQPSVARLERAEDTTLGRLWDYLYECGMTPTAIETVPVADLAQLVQVDPSGDRSAAALRAQRVNKRRDVGTNGAAGDRRDLASVSTVTRGSPDPDVDSHLANK